jgi:hypothetical protein
MICDDDLPRLVADILAERLDFVDDQVAPRTPQTSVTERTPEGPKVHRPEQAIDVRSRRT